jgi:hypothetical protein
MIRADGPSGDLVLNGRARDLVTGADGLATTAATAETRVVVDFHHDRAITEIRTTPRRASLETLAGVSAATGFRGAALRADPGLAETDGLLNLLVDDVPVAVLVSGHALGFFGTTRQLPIVAMRGTLVPDQCAGFATGATIMEEVRRSGRAPLTTGPIAPALVDDPDGWHRMEPLPLHGMRRARRMDVIAGELVTVDVLMRDTHMRPDGREEVIHEYTVQVVVDPVGSRVVACEATPRVLPWVECPAAVASARRLAGQPLEGLRSYVRQHFGGTTTCTHLNDTLRSLEDVPALIQLMSGEGAGG